MTTVAEPAPTTGHWGVDAATWQHPADELIDWAEVRAEGASFAIIKATQGDNYTNPWLKRDLAGARAAGLLVGAYHFYESGVAPEVQSARFTESIIGEILELGAWLDWEPADMPDWEVTTAYNGMLAGISEARRPVGVYIDQWWHARFVELKLVIHRLWLAAPSLDAAPPGTFIWQRAPQSVRGIIDLVDVDQLISTRGINLPSQSAPAPAPAPALVRETLPVEQEVNEAPGADPGGSEAGSA